MYLLAIKNNLYILIFKSNKTNLLIVILVIFFELLSRYAESGSTRLSPSLSKLTGSTLLLRYLPVFLSVNYLLRMET